MSSHITNHQSRADHTGDAVLQGCRGPSIPSIRYVHMIPTLFPSMPHAKIKTRVRMRIVDAQHGHPESGRKNNLGSRTAPPHPFCQEIRSRCDRLITQHCCETAVWVATTEKHVQPHTPPQSLSWIGEEAEGTAVSLVLAGNTN